MTNKAISEKVSFFNLDIKLAGTLYKPRNDQPCPAVIAVHPASEGEQTSAFFDHLESELPKHGIAVLVFDRRGSGGSEGDFETASFEDLADDVIAAMEYLQSRPDIDKTKIGLHGTSQGAWIAPIAAARKLEIAFIIAVSASGVSPTEQMNYGIAFHLEQDGFDQVIVDQVIELRDLTNEYFRGRVFREKVVSELSRFESEPWFEKGYLYSAEELPVDIAESKWHYEMDYEPLTVWKNVQQSTLFLFAEVDEWVPIQQSIVNYKNATNHLKDVEFKQIKGVNHMMRNLNGNQKGEVSEEYLDVLISWLTSRVFRPKPSPRNT